MAKPLIISRNFDEAAVTKFLKSRDPELGKLMKKIGPFKMKSSTETEPFRWLLRSIIYQQLHGKAAATIHGRLLGLFDERHPEPHEILAADPAHLQKAGLSRQKLAAIRDLARAAVEGQLPNRQQMRSMSDEDIIQTLIPIRGIGRWTVEMLLIFGLKRADILPADDFAIRKAAGILHGFKMAPDRKQLIEMTEIWSPWRTVASWYLWRSLDAPPDKKTAKK